MKNLMAIEKAVTVALKAHKGQTRKGDRATPYIVHPVAVAMILAPYFEKDPDVLCAAILHDVLEDTKYPAKSLEKAFGERVLKLVREVSDARPKAPWDERKDAYLKHLKTASKEACLIASADKTHNLVSIEEAYKKGGEQIWERFNAPKEDKIGFYESVYRIVNGRFSHPVIAGLKRALDQTKKTVGIDRRA